MEPLEIQQPAQLEVGEAAPPASGAPMKRMVVYGSMVACLIIVICASGKMGSTPSGSQDQAHQSSLSAWMPSDVLQLVGANKDDHGCLTSAGYGWCPSSETCVRPWIESCPEGLPFCQDYCKKTNKEKDQINEVTCRCKGDEALDYAPPPCTDVADYAESLESPCKDCQQGVAVIGGNCAVIAACNQAVNGLTLHDSLEECEQKCFPRQAKAHVHKLKEAAKTTSKANEEDPKCDEKEVKKQREETE